MPESRRRKKKVNRYVAPATSPATAHKRAARATSPAWFASLLLAMFVIGIVWLLIYYFSNGGVLGMQHLDGWNLAVGFGFIVVGLGLATRWK